MYIIGQEEADALTDLVLHKRLFRYSQEGTECDRFEARYREFLHADHVMMTSSGTTALTAAIAGLGIGPGDEVLVPACTYIASAIAVLACGAIPVVVDIDDSLTMDPAAAEAAIGPRTRALLPVHMWGLVADMGRLMEVAKRHNLLVIEDACQCVGGGWEGQMAGAIGDAGAFSFNYFKNMSCGEGGAVVVKDAKAFARATCMIDCCSFYWKNRDDMRGAFVAAGSRASELIGAVMNCQLDRLPGMISAMRNQKKLIIKTFADDQRVHFGKCNSPDWECGANSLFICETPEKAQLFAKAVGGFVAIDTGRHVFTAWDPLFEKQAGPNRAMNPYYMKENAECRKDLRKDQCPKSIDLLKRAVLLPHHPLDTDETIAARIAAIRAALGSGTL